MYDVHCTTLNFADQSILSIFPLHVSTTDTMINHREEVSMKLPLRLF